MERGVVESGGAGLVDFLEFVVCLEEGRMCGGGGGGGGRGLLARETFNFSALWA